MSLASVFASEKAWVRKSSGLSQEVACYFEKIATRCTVPVREAKQSTFSLSVFASHSAAIHVRHHHGLPRRSSTPSLRVATKQSTPSNHPGLPRHSPAGSLLAKTLRVRSPPSVFANMPLAASEAWQEAIHSHPKTMTVIG